MLDNQRSRDHIQHRVVIYYYDAWRCQVTLFLELNRELVIDFSDIILNGSVALILTDLLLHLGDHLRAFQVKPLLLMIFENLAKTLLQRLHKNNRQESVAIVFNR